MKKPIIGVFIGAVVYFVWGMVSWLVFPWHDAVIKKLPEEQLIMDTLKTVVTEPGFYFFPCDKGPDGRRDEKAFREKFMKGPNGVVVFSPGGREPMPPRVFLTEILANLVLASITMMLLCLTRDRVKGLVPRAFLIASGGLMVGMAVHVPYWNWFQFPVDFTRVAILDVVIGFLVLGVAQAKFVPQD